MYQILFGIYYLTHFEQLHKTPCICAWWFKNWYSKCLWAIRIL